MTVFVIADLHFGDASLCGSKRRPFADAAQMDAEIIRRWNETVTNDDIVYLLGDCGRRAAGLKVRHLRGVKHLIAGNGDDIPRMAKSGLFASVNVVRWLPRFVLSHVPIHPDQIGRGTVNIHGHLHASSVGDPRYVCVSVERTDYFPVPLADLYSAGPLPS